MTVSVLGSGRTELPEKEDLLLVRSLDKTIIKPNIQKKIIMLPEGEIPLSIFQVILYLSFIKNLYFLRYVLLILFLGGTRGGNIYPHSLNHFKNNPVSNQNYFPGKNPTNNLNTNLERNSQSFSNSNSKTSSSSYSSSSKSRSRTHSNKGSSSNSRSSSDSKNSRRLSAYNQKIKIMKDDEKISRSQQKSHKSGYFIYF